MRNLVIAIVVLAILGLGIFLLLRNTANQKSTNDTSMPATTDSTQTSQPAAESLTITYSDSGFSPSSSTLKSGGKVTVTNNSSTIVEFSSDLHPSHTDNNELNIGKISAGESKTITLTTSGIWGFHNHLDSSQTGKITVQ